MKRPTNVPLGRFLAGVALGALVLVPARADSISIVAPEREAVFDLERVDIHASRVVGFAPLSVDVQATLRDSAGHEMPLVPGGSAVLQVESSYYSLQNGSRQAQFYSGGETGLDNRGRPAEEALSRSLVINRPGTYIVRWVVRGNDGEEVLSKDVRIRVM
jgi:hypothetical protein